MGADRRFMGLDIGQRRIGVALSDPLGILASPHSVIPVGMGAGVDEVAALAARLGVAGIVVGDPLSLAGEEREQARRVRTWADQLRKQVQVPVILWDERLSTIAAERALIEAGMRREKRRQHRDAVAAALILQSYLDAQRAAQG